MAGASPRAGKSDSRGRGAGDGGAGQGGGAEHVVRRVGGLPKGREAPRHRQLHVRHRRPQDAPPLGPRPGLAPRVCAARRRARRGFGFASCLRRLQTSLA